MSFFLSLENLRVCYIPMFFHLKFTLPIKYSILGFFMFYCFSTLQRFNWTFSHTSGCKEAQQHLLEVNRLHLLGCVVKLFNTELTSTSSKPWRDGIFPQLDSVQIKHESKTQDCDCMLVLFMSTQLFGLPDLERSVKLCKQFSFILGLNLDWFIGIVLTWP